LTGIYTWRDCISDFHWLVITWSSKTRQVWLKSWETVASDPIEASRLSTHRCNVDIGFDQAEQSVAISATHKVSVPGFMLYNEIFRQFQFTHLDGLPRVKRDPGKFRQNEFRVYALALRDVDEYPIMAFFPIEPVNNQSAEAKQGSGGPPLFDVLIKRFQFLYSGLQVIILIHQQKNRVAVPMTTYHAVNPAHTRAGMPSGCSCLTFFFLPNKKTPAGRAIV
jgi:hypothetical protein